MWLKQWLPHVMVIVIGRQGLEGEMAFHNEHVCAFCSNSVFNVQMHKQV